MTYFSILFDWESYYISNPYIYCVVKQVITDKTAFIKELYKHTYSTKILCLSF